MLLNPKTTAAGFLATKSRKNGRKLLQAARKKNRFYNPIWQNAGHIKALKTFFNEYQDVPVYSLVVFSERCELKKVTVQAENGVRYK